MTEHGYPAGLDNRRRRVYPPQPAEDLRNRENDRFRWVRLIYGAYAILMFLHHIYVTLYFKEVNYDSALFYIPWITFAVMTFFLGQLWKDKAFWILVALLLLRVFRIEAAGPKRIAFRNEILIIGIYAYFGCYGAGRVFRNHPKDLKMFVSVFCLLWTLAMIAFSCCGIYVGWTGEPVQTPGADKFYLLYGGTYRLAPIYHMVEGGTLASASIAVAIIGFLVTKSKALRIFYILEMIVIYIAGALTVTRTAYILNAFAICYILFFWLESKHSGKQNGQLPKAGQMILKYCALFLGTVLLGFALIYLQMQFLDAFNAVKSGRASVVSTAMAETVADSAAKTIQSRDFVTDQGINGFLNDRLDIWRSTIEAFRRKPSILWEGESAYKSMKLVDSIRKEWNTFKASHTHNIFLQTILENGIPALVLFLGFLAFFLMNTVKTIRHKELPFWQRMISLPALVCVISDMQSINASATRGRPHMTIFYLFIGLTMACAPVKRKTPKRGSRSRKRF